MREPLCALRPGSGARSWVGDIWRFRVCFLGEKIVIFKTLHPKKKKGNKQKTTKGKNT